MRAIMVDDEPIMVRYFRRESADIEDINIVETFTSSVKALEFVRENSIEIAFLDVEMPRMNGIELAVELRKIRPDIIIVFISAYDYVRDSNKIGGDYYLMKPYDSEMLRIMMDRINLLAVRQRKKIYMHMLGTFTVTYEGKPIPLTGKSKEILAYIAAAWGKEVSNQFIYMDIWEGRTYDNNSMTVYFHALKRLKKVLEEYGLEDLLIATARGQMLNTELVDCDYYDLLNNRNNQELEYDGEFLTEYSWAESILANMIFSSAQ